jgi:hypothetical protein
LNNRVDRLLFLQYGLWGKAEEASSGLGRLRSDLRDNEYLDMVNSNEYVKTLRDSDYVKAIPQVPTVCGQSV